MAVGSVTAAASAVATGPRSFRHAIFTDSVGAFMGQPFSTALINPYEGSGVAATVECKLMEGLSLETITAHRQLASAFASATDGPPQQIQVAIAPPP